MSNSKKWLVVLLSVLVTVLCGVALAACNSNKNWREPKNALEGVYDPNNPNGDKPFYFDEGTNPDQYVADEDSYILKVTSKGGLPLNNVKLSISQNGVNIVTARTGEDGTVKLAISPGSYDISYDELPGGYFTDSETVVKLNRTEKQIVSTVNSAVIEDPLPGGYVYRAGDVMYNFSFRDYDNNTVELKELLEDYKFVLLNFYYNECGPCKGEFPAIQRTFEAYSSDAYVVSLSTQDKNSEVKAYKDAGYTENNGSNPITHPYTFFMAYDNQSLYSHFGTRGVPTNVFIDRYGVIAFIDAGGRPNDSFWVDLFEQFTADDYEQDSGLIEGSQGGGSGEEGGPAVKPPEDMHLPNDQALTEAVVDASMLEGGDNEYPDLPLHFYGPDPDDPAQANDAANSWPYQIGTDDEGNSYIYPGNLGTDNTYSILYTDLYLETDEVLTLEFKNNLKAESGETIYFIINNTYDYNFVFTSATENPENDDWVELTLFTATRPTAVNLNMMFVKDLLTTPEGEFVGIRNIKISPISAGENEALDVRTEMAAVSGDEVTYQNYYLNEEDGYYHVKTSNAPSLNDPIVYCDVLNESTWSIRHISKYILTYEGENYIKSIYNLSFYLYNEHLNDDTGITSFPYDPEEAIIDAFYVQRYSSQGYLVPVTESLRQALIGFTRSASQDQRLEYVGGFEEDKTWLELCIYYRTLGEGHDNPDHVCLSTTSPTLGLTIAFAIHEEFQEGETSLTFKAQNHETTTRNRVGGLFYELKLPEAGIYEFYIDTPSSTAVAPRAVIWNAGRDAYRGANPPIVDIEGTNNRQIAYFPADKTIYLQLSQVGSENVAPITFNMNVNKRTEPEMWVLTLASETGIYTFNPDTGDLYAPAVDIMLDPMSSTYYQTVDSEPCSPVYISFTRRNAYDVNGNTLKFMIDHGGFDLREHDGPDLTAAMNSYYNMSINGKDPGDEEYGMVEADDTLVRYIVQYTQSRNSNDTYESGVWKNFAYYYRYYGPEGSWKEPE